MSVVSKAGPKLKNQQQHNHKQDQPTDFCIFSDCPLVTVQSCNMYRTVRDTLEMCKDII